VAECGGASGAPGGGGGVTLPGGGGGTAPTPTPVCVVPKLRGKSLAAARRLLLRAGCAVGKVKRPRRPRHGRLRPLVVSAQSAKAGASVARGTKVRLTLKQKPRRR
jgi:beta-lactam-binding protein with PASTA domain